MQDGSKGITSSTEGKHEMECGSTFEVVFCGCLVIRPVDKQLLDMFLFP
jgi:hypothetical protein